MQLRYEVFRDWCVAQTPSVVTWTCEFIVHQKDTINHSGPSQQAQAMPGASGEHGIQKHLLHGSHI